MVESTLTIGKKNFRVRIGEFNQADLKFYVENPRVYNALRSSSITATPSQEDIERTLIEMEHVKQLKLSIESNGGLIDPLIVRDKDFVVLEGNSRLAAYRLLCKNDPIKWGKVKCTLLPSDIDDSSIFTLLGQYHIVGRKDWSPFEQAGYLYRRKQKTKYPIESMANELGITLGDAKKYISVYEFMIEHNDIVPERWSYYDEYLKNRYIKNFRNIDNSIDEVVVNLVKAGEISQAMDIRKLGDILSLPKKKAHKAFDRIKSNEATINDVYEILQSTGQINEIIKKLDKFKELINDPNLEKQLLDAVDEVQEKAAYSLNKISKRVQVLLKKIKE